MKKYVLSPGADGDLDEIWEYIAQDNVDAADRRIETLFKAFDTLAGNPGIGHTRTDLTDYPMLFCPVSAYLVIYRRQKRYIEIVAVTQGSRDIPIFLNSRQ